MGRSNKAKQQCVYNIQATLKENKELIGIYQQLRDESSSEVSKLKAEIRCVLYVWLTLWSEAENGVIMPFWFF